MSTRQLVCPAVLLTALCLAIPIAASAQSGESDAGEIAGLGGATFGAGRQATAMGSAGIAFSRYGMALVNVSYNPMGDHTIQPWPDTASVFRSHLIDFGVDFHVRYPVTKRLAPYMILGTGLLWNLVQQQAVTPAGLPVVYHWNQFNGAFHTGGGLRYYVRPSFGIRPEVRVIVSKRTYTEVLFGVFYVTPPEWP